MPLDIQAAERAKRSPSLSLMPLSFATIFGGLITLIGTPPNIIISAFREKETGTPYAMLDFAPVGFVVALAGLAFLALIGWRLVPGNRRKHDMGRELAQIDEFVTELRVPQGSISTGKTIADLDGAAVACDVAVLGLERDGTLLMGDSRGVTLQSGDTLVVKGTAKELDQFLGEAGLEYVGVGKHGLLEAGDLVLYEAVVPIGSEFEGRTAQALALQATHGIALLGISRRAHKLMGRIQPETIKAGDILLLYGPRDRVASTAQELGGLSLSDRGTEVLNRNMAWTAVGIFAAAVLLASLKILALPVALAAAVVVMLLLNIVPVRQVYTAIDWPVIVLLGSLIPVGLAVEQSGATTWIAQQILALLTGAAPWQILAGLMGFTMLVANVLNNTATAVVAGPIAATMAKALGVSIDPFLMAVAVGASCAFLTPIGHKTNTLILGPGGYRFGDFWLIGLPASVLAVAVAVPMILLIWPL
jgi:di/tricarboxylate transporter